jgi:hypothetical protein
LTSGVCAGRERSDTNIATTKTDGFGGRGKDRISVRWL